MIDTFLKKFKVEKHVFHGFNEDFKVCEFDIPLSEGHVSIEMELVDGVQCMHLKFEGTEYIFVRK